MNERLLEDIGLTRGEVRVYLTLLRVGETTTGKIVDEAGISSGKIYEILEKLSKKGLTSSITKDKTKYFSAASPKRILDYMREKEEALKRKEEELQKEIPLIMKAFRDKESSHETRFFRGVRGIRNALEEVMDDVGAKDKLAAMGIRAFKDRKFNDIWRAWNVRRLKKGMYCRGIFTDDTSADVRKSDYWNYYKSLRMSDVRLLKGITPSSIGIFGKYVLFLSYEDEPSCLVIKDHGISKSMMSFFESLWGIAEK